MLGAALFDRPLINRTELTERYSIALDVDHTPGPQTGAEPVTSSGTQLFTRTLSEPIALAGHLDDDGVREETIEGRRGRWDIAEEDAPVLRRSVSW